MQMVGGWRCSKESWSSLSSLSLGLSLKDEPFSALSPLEANLGLVTLGDHGQKSFLPALSRSRPWLCIGVGSAVFPGLLLGSSWFLLTSFHEEQGLVPPRAA